MSYNTLRTDYKLRWNETRNNVLKLAIFFIHKQNQIKSPTPPSLTQIWAHHYKVIEWIISNAKEASEFKRDSCFTCLYSNCIVLYFKPHLYKYCIWLWSNNLVSFLSELKDDMMIPEVPRHVGYSWVYELICLKQRLSVKPQLNVNICVCYYL